MCWASADEAPFPMKMICPPFLNDSMMIYAAALIRAGPICELVSALLFRSATIPSFIGVPPGDHTVGLVHEVRHSSTVFLEFLGDIVLPVVSAYEVHEPTSSGTGHLASEGTGLAGS